MAGQFTDALLHALTNDMGGDAALTAMVADLFTAVVPEDRANAAGAYTPSIVTAVEWPGYAQQAALSFAPAVRGSDLKWQARIDGIMFSGSGVTPPTPINITGIFFRITAGSTLTFAVNFDSPVVIAEDSQFIEIAIVLHEDGTLTAEVTAQ